MNQPDLDTWNRTQPKLKRFIARHTRDKTIADDIVQDVFLKFYTKLDQLRNSEKLSSWLYQIAKRSIIDHFRKSLRVIAIDEIDWDSGKNPLNACAEHCVKELLETLPEKYRQALELSELENHSQIELAGKLNISYSGAKSRVQRARQMLRARVHEKYHIETDRYGNVVVCRDKLPGSCPATYSELCE